MKNSLLWLIPLITINANAQWVSKTVSNGIDDPYKIAYCLDNTKIGILKLEAIDTGICLYVTGSYFCDEDPSIDMGLNVKGEIKKYTFTGSKSTDSKTLFFIDNILNEENKQFLNDFKNCSVLSLRVNESHCSSEFYKFNMTGSTTAISFMQKSRIK